MAYTPQAPTALSNGPTIIESQVETIVNTVRKLEAEGARKFVVTREAEDEWKTVLDDMSKITLMQYTDSWWNGANIPGKKTQSLVYVGGINVYEKHIRQKIDGWKGFNVVAAAA